MSSPRPFPDEVGDPDYPDDFEIRRVRKNGSLKHDAAEIHVGSVLRGEAVGVEPIDDGRYQLWFGPIYLGLLTHLGRGRVILDKNTPNQ